MGYHSDSQQQPLAITYPSPISNTPASVGIEKGTPNIFRQKRKYRRRIKTEPLEEEQVEPKSESISDIDESVLKSPVQTFGPPSEAPSELKTEPMDGVKFQSPGEKPIKKKVKVMLPSLDSPRGLRTLLPGIANLFNHCDRPVKIKIVFGNWKTRKQRSTSDSSEADSPTGPGSTNTLAIESRQHKSKKLAKRCGRGGRGVAGQF